MIALLPCLQINFSRLHGIWRHVAAGVGRMGTMFWLQALQKKKPFFPLHNPAPVLGRRTVPSSYAKMAAAAAHNQQVGGGAASSGDVPW